MIPYKIFPIADSALTIDFGNQISEEVNDLVIGIHNYLNNYPFLGFIESIPAYSSLSVFYEVSEKTNYKIVSLFFGKLLQSADSQIFTLKNKENNLLEIPIIYDGEDLDFVADFHELSVKKLIEIHTSVIYRVFMMGFLPGFAYLGGMSEKIATPRRDTPRKVVPAGSVGIAGKQTGIYPLDSPGGWQLIGRTETKLFDPNAKSPILLKAGDLVKFVQI